MATLAQAKTKFDDLLAKETAAFNNAHAAEVDAYDLGKVSYWEDAAKYWRAAADAASSIHLNAYNYENDHPSDPQTATLNPALGDWSGVALQAQQRALGYLDLAQKADVKVEAAAPKPSTLGKGKPRPVAVVDTTTGEVVEVDPQTGEPISPPLLDTTAGKVGLAAAALGLGYLAFRYLTGKR